MPTPIKSKCYKIYLKYYQLLRHSEMNHYNYQNNINISLKEDISTLWENEVYNLLEHIRYLEKEKFQLTDVTMVKTAMVWVKSNNYDSMKANTIVSMVNKLSV